MYSKKDIAKMGKGFYQSMTRNMDGQNRKTRRGAKSSWEKHKVGAMIIVGVGRFRYRCQKVFSAEGTVLKRIYHMDIKGSNW